MMGRIVFLYFVQKKDWLNNEKNFLLELFNTYMEKYNQEEKEKVNIYDKVIEQLFINGLNSQGDTWEAFDGQKFKIPYLNGGLFDADTDDKLDLSIPNKNLLKIFTLFNSYNFTIIEDTPHDSEVAVDPEMLGRVFEDLLEDRKEKGAFYTPREIVHYMCQQSIFAYLLNKFNNETAIKELIFSHKINEYVLDNLEDITKALENIKILDPAIGSGAFPMGMLHELTELLTLLKKEKLKPKILNAKNISEKIEILKELLSITKNLKRNIIQNSIYGIDIEPSAVEIAKLRFWLSIVVDEDEPTPLPNLFYKIMVGNSLVETIDGFDPLEKKNKKITKNTIRNQANQTADDIIVLLQKDLKDYFIEHNSTNKKELNKNINNKISTILKKSKKTLNTDKSLFNETKFEISTREQNLNIVKKIDKVISDYALNNNTTELFFYKIYFANIINNDGFDVIIGNPPYVRQERIKELKALKEIQEYKSYNGTADLYIYFFEKGYNLLKKGGVLSYITSNKYTRAKYGKNFREFVLKNTSILEYIDFNAIKIFESATVDTSILTFTKPHRENKFYYTKVQDDYKKGTPLQEYIQKNHIAYSMEDLSCDSFSFLDKDELAIKKKIEEVGIPLKEWDIKIYRGILTGYNEAFIIDKDTKDKLIEEDSKSKKIIQPLLRGRDIKKYSYEFANLYLINTNNGIKDKNIPPINIEDYPAIKKHLDKYYDKLVKRWDKGENWWNLRNCAYLDEFEKEKIIYSEIVQKPQFYLDNETFYIEATAFIMSGKDLKYLIALLNSTPVTFFFKKFYMGTELGSKGFRYKKTFLQKLPIPQIHKEAQKPFIQRVDKIIKLKKENQDTSELEKEIDKMVYELYGLSNEEIKIVEDNVKI